MFDPTGINLIVLLYPCAALPVHTIALMFVCNESSKTTIQLQVGLIIDATLLALKRNM